MKDFFKKISNKVSAYFLPIVSKFKSLPIKNQKLLGLGVVALLVLTLPVFIWAIINLNLNPFSRAASGEASGEPPQQTPTATPNATLNPTVQPTATPIIITPTPTATPITTTSPTPAIFPTPTPLPLCNIADFNHDGIVNSSDYKIFVPFLFGHNPQYDLNKDGIVDLTDYSILVNNYQKQTGLCQ